MANGEDAFRRTMASKDAIDALKAYRVYKGLIEDGWESDKAFLVAFMGVHILNTGLKPLPKPDPPFSLTALYSIGKEALSNIQALHKEVETDMAFLKKDIR